MNALQTLQIEFTQAPALIEAAMTKRDVAAAKRLKARLEELPDLIESARITDLESRLAALKTEDTKLSTAHKAACKAAEKAQEAYNAAASALANAVQARQVALSNLLACEASKQDCERELAISIKMQEADIADTPLTFTSAELVEWHRVQRRRAAIELELA